MIIQVHHPKGVCKEESKESVSVGKAKPVSKLKPEGKLGRGPLVPPMKSSRAQPLGKWRTLVC